MERLQYGIFEAIKEPVDKEALYKQERNILLVSVPINDGDVGFTYIPRVRDRLHGAQEDVPAVLEEAPLMPKIQRSLGVLFKIYSTS